MSKRWLLWLLVGLGFSVLLLGDSAPQGRFMRLANLFGVASAQATPAGIAGHD